jgi:CNT family concentrative nucleoside transporter
VFASDWVLRLTSLLGLAVMLGLAWGLSRHRRLFPWHTVLWGLGLQFVLAALILKTDVGKAVFGAARLAVAKIAEFSNVGAQMVFGPLADGEKLGAAFGPNAYVFAVTVTAVIVVVSSISAALYHYGILQKVVHGLAWVMRKLLRTSGSETLAAASNIFVGQTEAPLLIRPYLRGMTQSELMALMTCGFATVASSVLAIYAQLGVDAGHLLTASVLSAPAGLLVAKIMLPETEESETAATASAEVERTTSNGLDALCRGAGDGMMLAINVIAMLIAFVAIVALLNAVVTAPQAALGVADPVTLQRFLGWVNWPFAWVIGIRAEDCAAAGQVLGERIVLNEFIGYLSLAELRESMDERSFILTAYALCGFANLSSIAIQIGGIGSLVPERRGDLARLGLRAMVGGVLACYLSATVVGVLL